MTEISTPQIIEEKLPLKSKLGFGFIGTASSAMEGMLFGSITFYYSTKLLLEASYISIAWLIFAIWNTINDPIFGILEERTKTRIGRRIPYIRYGSLIYGALFILSWFPLFGRSQIALFINLLLVLCAFDTIFTIIGLITYNLPAEMAFSAEARANLSVYNTILGAIGVLISMMVPMFFLTDDSPGVSSTFYIAVIIIGIVSTIVMFTCSFFLKENYYTQREEPLGFWLSLKMGLKNRPFLIFEVNMFLYVSAYTILTTAIFFYVDFVLKLQGSLAMIPLAVIFGLLFIFSAIISLFIKRFGLKWIYIGSLFFASAAFFLTFGIGRAFPLALIGLALIAVGIAGRTITEQAIMGDIIDYDEILTGKRRETTYSGFNAIVVKPAVSFGNWLFLWIIDKYGYDEEAITQTFNAETGIMIGFLLIPGILMLLAAISVIWFPLDGPTWLVKKAEISRIHQQKEEQYRLEQYKKSIIDKET